MHPVCDDTKTIDIHAMKALPIVGFQHAPTRRASALAQMIWRVQQQRAIDQGLCNDRTQPADRGFDIEGLRVV
jgi:hypothetical protein